MKIYAQNKKVRHDYHILETFTAGMSLLGPEVKSIRNGNISLKESYIKIKDNQALLLQAHINKPEYLDGFTKFEEVRQRPLLLTKKELKTLEKAVKDNGITIMAIKCFQPEKGKNIKLEIAICKGKRDFDKRETIKRRQADIDTKRQMKDF